MFSCAGEVGVIRGRKSSFLMERVGAEETAVYGKRLRGMFGSMGSATAAHLFNVVAALQEHEGVRLQVVA